MADFTDLAIRYTDGANTAQLLFNNGLTCVEVSVTPVATVKPVANATELRQALAMPGRYKVKAGNYVGNFVTAAAGVQLDCEDGVTFAPSDISKPVFQVNADNFSLLGGSILSGINEGVIIGSPTATTAEAQPNNVTFSDVTVNAPSGGAHRGFAIHSRATRLERVRVSGFYRVGQETQAVYVCNGPGPYTFLDCYLEAAGENILFGGDKVWIPGCVPSDILMRGCTFFKTPEMKANAGLWKVKNSIELKIAQRVLIEHCIIDGCWAGGQNGNPIVFTVRNSAKANGNGDNPWVIVDDVTFRHNIVRNAPQGFAVSILGHDDGGRVSEQTKRIIIEDNLFEHCASILQINSGVTEMLSLKRNTWPVADTHVVMFSNIGTKTHLEIVENAGKTGVYGVFASGGKNPLGAGTGSLIDGCGEGNYVMTGNVLEKTLYKNSAGVLVPARVNLPAGNTQLAPGTLGLDPSTFVLPGGAAGWSGPAN